MNKSLKDRWLAFTSTWSVVAGAFVSTGLSSIYPPPGTSEPAKSPPIQKIRLEGHAVKTEIADRLEQLGIKVAIRESKLRQIVILAVHTGSSAYSKGLEPGDTIEDIDESGGFVTITIDRNGKRYRAALKSPPGEQCTKQAIADFLGFAIHSQRSAASTNANLAVINNKTLSTSSAGAAKATEPSIPDDQERDWPDVSASTCWTMASETEQKKSFTQAISLYKTAASKYLANGDPVMAARALFHTGICYNAAEKYPQSAFFYDKALENYERAVAANLKVPELRNCINQYAIELGMMGKRSDADNILKHWSSKEWHED